MQQGTAGGASLQCQVPSLGERMCIFTPMIMNVAWLSGFGDVVLGVFADSCHHVADTGCGNWSWFGVFASKYLVVASEHANIVTLMHFSTRPDALHAALTVTVIHVTLSHACSGALVDVACILVYHVSLQL